MFHTDEIRPSRETKEFLTELKELLHKHSITIMYGEHTIEFYKDGQRKIAQAYCFNGLSHVHIAN